MRLTGNSMVPRKVVLLLSLCAGWACAPRQALCDMPELAQLHALLIIDTRSGLGESVEVDGRRIRSLLQTGIAPEKLDLTVFDKASHLTRANILGYFRNLKTGPSEAVFVYYAGHGATDPEKGQFLALQELNTEPLTRDDLRRAMLQKKPGLIVILTDCCSNRFELKKKNRDVWDLEHRDPNPVVHNLFFQHRGVVDITASTGNEAFGDEHQGGIFTRTLGKLLKSKSAELDTNHDGFVEWKEFFPHLQKDTERTFVSWAQKHRALGEQIEQNSQRPRALHLPGEATTATAVVTLRNDTNRTIQYEYRWSNSDSWKKGSIAVKKSATHAPPPGQEAKSARMEIRSVDGNGTARPGDSLRFHD